MTTRKHLNKLLAELEKFPGVTVTENAETQTAILTTDPAKLGRLSHKQAYRLGELVEKIEAAFIDMGYTTQERDA